ncbi:MAG: hypothetical protein ACI4VK_04900 [Candidatus Coproplasma sp.]
MPNIPAQWCDHGGRSVLQHSILIANHLTNSSQIKQGGATTAAGVSCSTVS